MKRIKALALLAWHVVLHVAKVLTLAYRRGGSERFLLNYRHEGLLPVTPEERSRLPAFQRCIGCGLCDGLCPAASTLASGHGVGVFARMAAGTRDLPQFGAWETERQAALDCASCRACTDVCPVDVPIPDVAAWIVSLGDRERKVGTKAPD